MNAIKLISFLFLLNCLLCWVFTSNIGSIFGPLFDPIFFIAGFLSIGLYGFVSIESSGREVE